jgi:hypothetical protein
VLRSKDEVHAVVCALPVTHPVCLVLYIAASGDTAAVQQICGA